MHAQLPQLLLNPFSYLYIWLLLLLFASFWLVAVLFVRRTARADRIASVALLLSVLPFLHVPIFFEASPLLAIPFELFFEEEIWATIAAAVQVLSGPIGVIVAVIALLKARLNTRAFGGYRKAVAAILIGALATVLWSNALMKIASYPILPIRYEDFIIGGP